MRRAEVVEHLVEHAGRAVDGDRRGGGGSTRTTSSPTTATACTTRSGGGSGGAGSGSGTTIRALSETCVPHPAGTMVTVPQISSPSQATVVSGSRLVTRISPKSPRCWASVSGSLSSSHSSGGDFTSLRCAWISGIDAGFARPAAIPSAVLRWARLCEHGPRAKHHEQHGHRHEQARCRAHPCDLHGELLVLLAQPSSGHVAFRQLGEATFPR